MFYSADLLSIRGGKFSTVWLMGNSRDRKQTATKKRVEIRKLNITSICEEMLKMLPVHGKERSFSLRLSSILLYGTCVVYRYKIDNLLSDSTTALSRIYQSRQQSSNIDLPNDKDMYQTRCDLPDQADISLGIFNWQESLDNVEITMPRLPQVDENLITMRDIPSTPVYEGPNFPGLDYEQSLEMLEGRGIFDEEPVRKRNDPSQMNNVDWNEIDIDENEDHGKGGRQKRDIQDAGNKNKKIRGDSSLAEASQDVDPLQDEQQHLIADNDVTMANPGIDLSLLGAPARKRVPSHLDIETPTVEIQPTRKTPPTMDDIELPELIVTHVENINIQDDETILPDQAAAENIDVFASPQNQDDKIVPDDDMITQGHVLHGSNEAMKDQYPEGEEDIIPEIIIPDAIIPPAIPQDQPVDANIELNNIEAPVVIPKKVPKKRVQKKRGVVWIDEHIQIDRDSMRGNLEDYSDIMRCGTPRQDRRISQAKDTAEILLNGPGRKLGKVLGKSWSCAKKTIDLYGRMGTWDFGQTDPDDAGENRALPPTEDNNVPETNVAHDQITEEAFLDVQPLNLSKEIERQEIEREPDVEGSLIEKSNNFDKSRASSINATVVVEEKTHEEIETGIDNVGESNLENIQEEPEKNLSVIRQSDVEKVTSNQGPALVMDMANSVQEEQITLGPVEIENSVLGPSPVLETDIPDIEQEQINLNPTGVEDVTSNIEPERLSPMEEMNETSIHARQTFLEFKNTLMEKNCCYFSEVCEPRVSSRLSTSRKFFYILQLEKAGSIKTEQDVNYGPIKINQTS